MKLVVRKNPRREYYTCDDCGAFLMPGMAYHAIGVNRVCEMCLITRDRIAIGKERAAQHPT